MIFKFTVKLLVLVCAVRRSFSEPNSNLYQKSMKLICVSTMILNDGICQQAGPSLALQPEHAETRWQARRAAASRSRVTAPAVGGEAASASRR